MPKTIIHCWHQFTMLKLNWYKIHINNMQQECFFKLKLKLLYTSLYKAIVWHGLKALSLAFLSWVRDRILFPLHQLIHPTGNPVDHQCQTTTWNWTMNSFSFVNHCSRFFIRVLFLVHTGKVSLLLIPRARNTNKNVLFNIMLFFGPRI